MERMPNELLLAFFEGFSFNEVRAVMTACSRWRALREHCRGFWADIQTPRSDPMLMFDRTMRITASEIACARIACTNGRKFTLRLHGLFPRILAAVAEHMHHVERLEVKLGNAGDMGVLSDAIRGAQAPELFALSLTFYSHALGSDLPRDLFASMTFPALTTVVLTNVRSPEDGSLQCFSGAQNVRYWPHGDLLAPSPPDLFAHFPSMRSLSLRGHVANMDYFPLTNDLTVMERLRAADWSRIVRLELLGSCWELARHENWPLHNVPHISCSHSGPAELPFVDTRRLARAHIVFACDSACVQVGNDSWSYSRSCAMSEHEMNLEETSDGFAGQYYNISIPDSLGTAIVSATVPAADWHLYTHTLRHLVYLQALRIVLDEEDSLETLHLGYDHRVPCAHLDTLILRATSEMSRPARITHDAVSKFAIEQLADVAFPVRLQLENLELTGQPSSEFSECFSVVAFATADAWSYLSLEKGDPWNTV